MTCKECEKFQEEGNKIYFYRWKIANVGLLGCEQHAGEIIEVLNKYQKGELK